MTTYKTGTKCIQSGWNPKNGEPRVLPIYQSTTFKYNSSDQMARLFDLEEDGFYYSRLQNSRSGRRGSGNVNFKRTIGHSLFYTHSMFCRRSCGKFIRFIWRNFQSVLKDIGKNGHIGFIHQSE